MTAKTLYEWTLEHNAEDFELLLFNEWDERAWPLNESKMEIDAEEASITIA